MLTKDITYSIFRYYTRTILQFQFAETLCNIADPDVPLHRCDFSGSKAGGKKLSQMLKLGSSVPWPKALKALTGGEEMSVTPLLRFFEPLKKWLEHQNKYNNDKIGWGK